MTCLSCEATCWRMVTCSQDCGDAVLLKYRRLCRCRWEALWTANVASVHSVGRYIMMSITQADTVHLHPPLHSVGRYVMMS